MRDLVEVANTCNLCQLVLGPHAGVRISHGNRVEICIRSRLLPILGCVLESLEVESEVISIFNIELRLTRLLLKNSNELFFFFLEVLLASFLRFQEIENDFIFRITTKVE